MGEWFHRDCSSIRELDPEVYSQGSFRLGTVIPPLLEGEEYDLDLVVKVLKKKCEVSPKELKNLIGVEVKSYSEAQCFKESPEEGKRCWTQSYQDSVNFHMDILPSIPEEEARVNSLISAGVPAVLAQKAIAITDNTHQDYESVPSEWPSSNSKGYACLLYTSPSPRD